MGLKVILVVATDVTPQLDLPLELGMLLLELVGLGFRLPRRCFAFFIELLLLL